MTDPITVKCAVCGLPATWEGPHSEKVDDVAYFRDCQHIPTSRDLGCSHLKEAFRLARRLAEQANRPQK